MHIAAQLDEGSIRRDGEQLAQDGPDRLQIADRLEQGHETESGDPGGEIDQADVAGENRRGEDVVDALGHRDDVALDDVVAVLVHAVAQDLEQCPGLVGLARLGCGERPGRAEFVGEQRRPTRLVEPGVVRADRFEELGKCGVMFRGVLTDVERGEMEADEPDETSHPGEASVGDQRATGGLQRTSEHVEILGELGRAAVGPRPGRGLGGLQQTLVHDGEALPVGLAGTQRPESGPNLREVLVVGLELGLQFGRDRANRTGDAELGRQLLDLSDQQPQRPGPLEVEHLAGGLRFHVGVAVAITADPRPEAHRLGSGIELETEGAKGCVDVVEEFRHPLLQHLAEEVQDGSGLVDGIRFLASKLVGLPDHVEEFVDAAVDASDDRLVVLGHPLFDEKGDLGELVEDRPARGLGRVRGEHGIQLHLVDGGGDVVRGETQFDETRNRLGDPFGPGGAILGEVVDAVDLLRRVRKMEVGREGPHELDRSDDVGIAESVGELLSDRVVALA